ncbi:MAG: phospholipase A [Candidatus Electryonea clarkiae]|nr:phospholipase A [Candidatus Electryonea clarkiae]MDP8288501.1 phospholipase A [Candidatus Electryonea clarkiae]
MPEAGKYLGDSESMIVYNYPGARISCKARWSNTLEGNYVSSQTDLYFKPSFLIKWMDFFLYLQYWNGYGEQLREYKNKTNEFRVGIMMMSDK